MFCGNCGKEIPDDSVFCTYCGTACEQKTTQPTNDQNLQETTYNQAAAEHPSDSVLPKKKRKRTKVKLIAILAAIVIIIAGIGTFAYNAQPVFFRLFNGEKEHFSMLIDRFEDKYNGNESTLLKNVKAKITNKISYDLKHLESLGAPLGNISDSEISLNQIIRIDSDKDLVQIDQNGALLGVELPEISSVVSSGDIGIYIQYLTKEYISFTDFYELSSLINTAQTYQEVPDLSISSPAQLKELLPLLEKYKDNLNDTALNSGDIVYQTNNDDLGFNTYYYEITLTPETICDIVKNLIETFSNDDELKLKLIELTGQDDTQTMMDQLNASIEELMSQINEDQDSFIQELETQVDEIKIELWFDGKNQPLGMSLQINSPSDSSNQDVEFTMLDYKHGRDAVTLFSLKADDLTLLEFKNEAEINGSRQKGSFSLKFNEIELLNGEYDLNNFEIRGIELYEGTATCMLSTENISEQAFGFELELNMERINNGVNMEFTPSITQSGITINLGDICSNITIEELDQELDEINIVEINQDNYSEYLTLDEFAVKIEELAAALQDVMGGLIPSTDLPIY